MSFSLQPSPPSILACTLVYYMHPSLSSIVNLSRPSSFSRSRVRISGRPFLVISVFQTLIWPSVEPIKRRWSLDGENSINWIPTLFLSSLFWPRCRTKSLVPPLPPSWLRSATLWKSTFHAKSSPVFVPAQTRPALLTLKVSIFLLRYPGLNSLGVSKRLKSFGMFDSV